MTRMDAGLFPTLVIEANAALIISTAASATRMTAIPLYGSQLIKLRLARLAPCSP